MSEDKSRLRRIKCLTLKAIWVDLDDEGIDSATPKKIKAGEIVLLAPIQFEHYIRKKAVTRDVPPEEE